MRLTDLAGANLSGVYLLWVDLMKGSSVASHPSLFEPVVCLTDLTGADLRGADLSDTDLRSAILQRADLSGANVTPEQLATAKYLEGAILPDGTKHK